MEKEFTMEEKIKDFKPLYEGLDDRQKKIVEEKHLGLLAIAVGKKVPTMQAMQEYDVSISKANEIITTTKGPENMHRDLELSRQMGFVDSYREKPRRTTHKITDVVKRLGESEAKSIPYKRADGTTEDFIFNGIMFEEVKKQMPENVIPFPTNNVEAVVPQKETTNDNIEFDDLMLKTNRLAAIFGLEDDAPTIEARVQFAVNNGEPPSKALNDVFKTYGGDPDFLESKIAEVLSQEYEESIGGRAA